MEKPLTAQLRIVKSGAMLLASMNETRKDILAMKLK
jgi:hypothetical protein